MVDEEGLRRQLKRQENIAAVPIILLGATIIFSYFSKKLFGIDGLEVRSIAIVTYFVIFRPIERHLDKLSRREVAVDATDRLHSLVPGDTSRVRIDQSLKGIERVNWCRDGDDVVVSRKAILELTTEELDFALTSATDMPITVERRGQGYTLRSWLGLVALAGGTFGVMALGFPWPLWLILFFAGFACWITLVTSEERKKTDRIVNRLIEADDAALGITRNREAAQSALTKAIVKASATDKSTWEARLRNIRYAEHRAMASTLPPRGWKPS